MDNDYKNIIELKDGTDEKLSKTIKEFCLEVYNKGEEKVKLIDIDDRHFELVTDEEGKGNLLVGLGLAQRNTLLLNNIESWYWEEPNKFECGDVLACMREVGLIDKSNRKLAF